MGEKAELYLLSIMCIICIKLKQILKYLIFLRDIKFFFTSYLR